MSAPIARLAVAVLCGYVAIGAGIQILPEAARERFGAARVGDRRRRDRGLAGGGRRAPGRRAGARTSAGRAAWSCSAALLAGVGALGQLLAPSLAWLVVARLLIGAGEGALFTAAITWVLATAPPERRGRIVGHFGLSMWGGLALGPPLGAALAAATSAGVVWWACVIAPVVPALAFAGHGVRRRAGRGRTAAQARGSSAAA